MVKQWKKSLDGDDVQAEAEDALEKDINNLSPASNSIAANLDGGVAAVDWSSKTIDTTSPGSSVSGSGYLIGVHVQGVSTASSENIYLDITVDGSGIGIALQAYANTDDNVEMSIPVYARFDSGFSTTLNDGGYTLSGGLITYVLD